MLDNNPNLSISKLVTVLKDCPNIKVVLLRDNNLKFLPKDLKGFSSLKVLELSKNNFSQTEKERIKNELSDTKVIF